MLFWVLYLHIALGHRQGRHDACGSRFSREISCLPGAKASRKRDGHANVNIRQHWRPYILENCETWMRTPRQAHVTVAGRASTSRLRPPNASSSWQKPINAPLSTIADLRQVRHHNPKEIPTGVNYPFSANGSIPRADNYIYQTIASFAVQHLGRRESQRSHNAFLWLDGSRGIVGFGTSC